MDWNSKRLMATGTNKSQYFKPVEQIKDIWEDSDIPSAVIFDPTNVANLIVGYVSGDLVRYDIEKGEYNWNQVGTKNQSERIISLTKSLTATHNQTQDTIPLLVTTNHGYLHIVDSREFQTIFSHKAPQMIDKHQSIISSISFSMALQLHKLTFLPADRIQISNSTTSLCNNSDIIHQLYPNKSMEWRLRLSQGSDQMKQIQMEQIERQKYQSSPLEKWKENVRFQLASQSIFTSSTYLQFDRLIAAGTNSGKVHIFDLRMGDKGQIGLIGEHCEQSFHSPMFSEGITKIAAHPQHPILVTAGADGIITVFSSNPPQSG
ncbi:MAG: hypothetical protein EZS28_029272 [Streblomastix strix]|uniref:Uncharacterized protein n=1 Tax=Streblomastix strix TaxID=222440 RepID=A0A5J4UYM0_9EUKA|nr:MAG: hypothetical protein EZS28_029272 [Streblomastix strix]